MRRSVVDVGSQTVRLVVADTEAGAPLPVHSVTLPLRLADRVGRDGRLSEEQQRLVVGAVGEALAEAERWRAPAPFAFATAIVRDAPNREEILAAVHRETGLRLRVMPGEEEAELAYLAARRWVGWQAGRMGLLDIGGGTFEVAIGSGRLPHFAVSLPLGAGRLTREFLAADDPPSAQAVKALRRHLRHQLRDVATRFRWESPRTVVAASRTFQQLARLCGGPRGTRSPFVVRELARDDLRWAVRELARLPAKRRAKLPGISAPRARQSLAGALVAHTAMTLMGVRSVALCPWAVREGILLRLIEDEPASGAATDGLLPPLGAARLPLARHSEMA